jgi:hypothetical protein
MANRQDRSVVMTAGGLQALRKGPLDKVEGIVLWHLVATLPAFGDVISQAQLASDLAITVVHINNVMKRLCSQGFVMRGAKVGRSYHYKLNPAFFIIIA